VREGGGRAEPVIRPADGGARRLCPACGPAARVARSESRDRLCHPARRSPDFAEPVIGPAKGGARWLNPGYRLCQRYWAAAVLMIATTAPTAAFAQAPGPPTDAEILALMHTHCVPCHAAEPTHAAFAKAPAGVLLETIPQIAANAARIMTQVVVQRAMPLGNETGMTDEERDRIAAWIEGRNK
jgi:mono/diheme cytochrome c family protein